MKVWRPQTAHALRQGSAWSDLVAEVASCLTVSAVWAWWNDYLLNRHRNYPEGWSLQLRDQCDAREAELLSGEHHAELDDEYRNIIGGCA